MVLGTERVLAGREDQDVGIEVGEMYRLSKVANSSADRDGSWLEDAVDAR